MKATELSIPGAWLFEPSVFPDARGMFVAPFQGEVFREALGFDLLVRQTNLSRSSRGVVRGIHFADTPPGQAKYLYCPQGVILDVVVDLRLGSPTFLRSEAVELDSASMGAIYLAEGLGHAFMALEDETVVAYLCSTPFTPSAERGVTPLDPELAVGWPSDIEVVLSEKDASAPTVEAAREMGILPNWKQCRAWYDSRQELKPVSSDTSVASDR